MPPAPRLRPAVPADAEALARSLTEGIARYGAFAPQGWEPPTVAFELALIGPILADPGTWACVAETESGDLAGQACFIPAAKAREPVADPALAHLRNLFLEPPFWGTGLAERLHDAALGAAAERGYAEMRLFAAAGQARARRFYEREGWHDTGRAAPPLGALEFVEYRRALEACGEPRTTALPGPVDLPG